MQSFCAQAALFLLPLPALKYTATSLTLADLFLVLAVLMNLDYVLRRIHAFQIPLLLAFPLFLLSHLFDADCELVSIFQVCYVWGLLVPFGWCAFVNVPLRRIALLVLTANVLSAWIGAGQFMGFVPALPAQRIIEVGSTMRRAAGLSLQCNALAMTLTPCFLLLPYLPRISPRILTCLSLLAGFIATVSKSAILATPGILLYFFWREPEKGKLLKSMAVLIGLGLFALILGGNDGLFDVWEFAKNAVHHRLEYADHSVDERANVINIALDYSQECLLFGFGTSGCGVRLALSEGNTVHVFYLGLVMIGGYLASALIVTGFLLIVGGLWRQCEVNVAIFLLAHMLAICVTTVLYLSFQYQPILIAASVLVANNLRAGAARSVP